jgi:copper homeostasis protein
LWLVESIAATTPLPLRVMVRENAGYELLPAEVPCLRAAAARFHSLGVDGLVVGFSREQRLVLDDLHNVLSAAPGARATFHRAFDQLADPLSAIDALVDVPQIDRVLTDGGGGRPADRARRLREYVARAGARLEILAGGGVDEQAFEWFAKEGCVREIHVGRAARDRADPDAPVSAACVRRLRALAG